MTWCLSAVWNYFLTCKFEEDFNLHTLLCLMVCCSTMPNISFNTGLYRYLFRFQWYHNLVIIICACNYQFSIHHCRSTNADLIVNDKNFIVTDCCSSTRPNFDSRKAGSNLLIVLHKKLRCQLNQWFIVWYNYVKMSICKYFGHMKLSLFLCFNAIDDETNIYLVSWY